VDFSGWSKATQRSGLSNPLLDQFVEDAEVGRHAILRVALRLHLIVLRGCDLGQELLVEQSQPLLLLEDVLVVESHPFSFEVRLYLVFLHLLFHLVEYLEELIFLTQL